MTIETDQEQQQERGCYDAPKLTVLDTSDTNTGPTPDPNELNGFLQMS